MNLKTVLGQLRILALVEGISYLLLFGVTMPLKYLHEIELPNKIVGMIHGVLFIAFCVWIVRIAVKNKWSILKTLVGLASSLLPFATFILDAKVLKNEK
jgi:integral membrane protein